jgi:hypothetical protein
VALEAGITSTQKYGCAEDHAETENEVRRRCTQGCTNPRHLVSRGPRLSKVAPNTLSIISDVCFPDIQKVYQFTHTKQKAPDDSNVQRSLQNCGSSVWKVTILAPKIWKHGQDFWKMCASLGESADVQVVALK